LVFHLNTVREEDGNAMRMSRNRHTGGMEGRSHPEPDAKGEGLPADPSPFLKTVPAPIRDP
jgi:hypothetical protein